MQSGGKMKPLMLLSFGNPLLDITIVVGDTSIHKKFDLQTDGQLEISKEQEAIFDIAMSRKDAEYTAGGCSLNTSRVFSWVLGKPNRVLFVGGIGKDDRAKKLKSIIDKSKVITRFVEVGNLSTGCCVALVLGAQRCLCANIGAASVCRPEHVFGSSINELQAPLNSAPVIYLEGYFITHSFDTALKVAQHCKKVGKTLIFNLCGSYVCENQANELLEILPLVDVLFGYIEEYRTLEKFVDIPKLCKNYSIDQENIVHDLNRIFKGLAGEEQIAKKSKHVTKVVKNGILEKNHSNFQTESEVKNISNIALSETNGCSDLHHSESDYWSNLKGKKLVVVTQGPSPLLYASDKQIFERPVAPICPSLIIDTTGAGDSFVGGFLAAAAVGECLEICLDCGVWAAQQLLQQKGCTIPSYPSTFL